MKHALEITLQHGVDRRCLSAAFWKQTRNCMALTDIPRHRHGISTHTYSLQTCPKMMMFSGGHVAAPLNAARLQTIKQQDVTAVAEEKIEGATEHGFKVSLQKDSHTPRRCCSPEQELLLLLLLLPLSRAT